MEEKTIAPEEELKEILRLMSLKLKSQLLQQLKTSLNQRELRNKSR